MLADRSGRSKRFSEDFLREFFNLISERLESGDSVKIKGLGTFRLSRVEPRRSVDVTTGQPMEISGHSKVVFLPAKELAEAVNSPFEAFSAIEISDDADISQLISKDEIELGAMSDELTSYADQDITEEATAVMIKETGKAIAHIEEEECLESKESIANEEEDEKCGNSEKREEAVETVDRETSATKREEVSYVEAAGESDVANEIAPAVEFENNSNSENKETSADNTEEECEEDELLEEEKREKRRWGKIALVSLVAVLIALFATLCIWYYIGNDDFNGIFNIAKTALNPTKRPTGEKLITDASGSESTGIPRTDEGILTSDDTLPDSEESEVPTAPSDALVYDTISTTRYLTSMARTHYGNFNFWPYIYEENKAILGHPDRIRPGTPVVIPALSKYGVDPKNKEDIETAKKMGVEIYARYGKKI